MSTAWIPSTLLLQGLSALPTVLQGQEAASIPVEQKCRWLAGISVFHGVFPEAGPNNTDNPKLLKTRTPPIYPEIMRWA